MLDHTDDGSGRGKRPVSGTKAALQIERLQDRLACLIGEMRRRMSSLCGRTPDDGAKVMKQLLLLRQKMRLTRRRITNLEFQDRSRN